MKNNYLKIVECPRDAMQGISEFIPTGKKIEYINSLLKVNFDILDFGSFVSPKAIPQMQDTEAVLKELDLSNTTTKLSVVVANIKGAENALKFDEIEFLGFPFSISETFQMKNTNSTIEKSLESVKYIQDLAVKTNKKLLIYISMGFGNPYGDTYNYDIVSKWIYKLQNIDIKYISLADTIGISNPEKIEYIFPHLLENFQDISFGAHLHSNPNNWEEKLESLIKFDIDRIDSAIMGYGGCPMAQDELIGNMPTEKIINYFNNHSIKHNLNINMFNNSMNIAKTIFH